jgi:hypothetical protein
VAPDGLVERLVAHVNADLAATGRGAEHFDFTLDPEHGTQTRLPLEAQEARRVALEGTLRIIASRIDLAAARDLGFKHFDFLARDFFTHALASSGDARALPFLRKRARAGDVDVRVAAAKALVAVGDPGADLLLEKAWKAHSKATAF